jgi:hypothetical protein
MASITIDYQEIFSAFLGNVTDYKLASLDEASSNSLMTEWLHKSFGNMYIRRLFSSFVYDDEVQTLTILMARSVSDDIDKEFVVNVFSKQMVCEWIRPQVVSTTNLLQVFGGKEQKFYSQKEHLLGLKAIENEAELAVRNMISDRGYIYNGYLGG